MIKKRKFKNKMIMITWKINFFSREEKQYSLIYSQLNVKR